jgi:hypothetical protein
MCTTARRSPRCGGLDRGIARDHGCRLHAADRALDLRERSLRIEVARDRDHDVVGA